MKIIFFLLIGLLVGCKTTDTSIQGILKLKPGSGWKSLDFTSTKTFKDSNIVSGFSLVDGSYTLTFEEPWFSDYLINVWNGQGQLIGKIAIPKDIVKEDGSFELYGSDERNSNSFNMLGGVRKLVLSKHRYPVLRASCTYTETYICSKRNAKGESYTSTCTRSRSGHRDEVWEERIVKSNYRILFDARDMENIAVFNGATATVTENYMLDSESCR